MRLGQQAFLAHNQQQAGQEMYDELMAQGSPVPPNYINVRQDAHGGRWIAVPAASAADFVNLPNVGLVPQREEDFSKTRAGFTAEVGQKSIHIHQRGYGISDATSAVAPWLSTMQIAPCIVCMVYSPNTKTGALTHVDANMNEASIATVVDEFPPRAPLDFSFHGGLVNNDHSKRTCWGLLQALYDIEGNVVVSPGAVELSATRRRSRYCPRSGLAPTPGMSCSPRAITPGNMSAFADGTRPGQLAQSYLGPPPRQLGRGRASHPKRPLTNTRFTRPRGNVATVPSQPGGEA